MATAFIFNGYGDYDSHKGETGTSLKWAGIDFFFPYGKTTILADRTLREVDHDATTVSAGQVSVLTYKLASVKGNYIAEQLTAHQIPTTNHDMGIQVVQGKPTGKVVEVNAGYDLDGTPITVEVSEKEATPIEKERAFAAAAQFKEMAVSDYFQSKRERMNGGTGRKYPDARIRAYMNELGVIDNDDVTAHAKPVGGLTPELIEAIGAMVMKAGEVKAVDLHEAVESVRKAGKAQVVSSPNARRSQGLAEHKAAFEAAEKEKEVVQK